MVFDSEENAKMKLFGFYNLSFVVTLIAVSGLFSLPQMMSSKTASAASEPIIVPFGKVVLNSFNGKLYIAEGFDETVKVVDPTTNTIVDSIFVGPSPANRQIGIAFNPENGNLYVPDGEVTKVINVTTNTIETSIGTGTGSTQGPFVFNSVNGKFYAASTYDNFLHIIDSATNEPVGSPIQLYGVPGKIAFSPLTGDVYVTVSADVDCGTGCAPSDNRRVMVIDGTSNTVKDKILVGTSPTGIVASSNGNLYVLNAQNSTVSVIDGSTNTVIGDPIPVGVNATTSSFNVYDVPFTPSPIIFDPINGKVYVIMNDNTLTIIDSVSNEPVGAPISLPGSTVPALGAPAAIDVNPVDGDVYVISSQAIFAEMTLTVIDGWTNEIVGPVLRLGNNFPIAIGAHPDSGTLYSLNLVDGELSVIDPLEPPLPTWSVSFISHFHEGGPFPGFGAPVTDDVISGCSYGLYGDATKQGEGVTGFWSNLHHKGFQTGDFGTFDQLTTDGETFEVRGMRTGEGDGTMQVICEGEPVSNSDMPVVVMGDCGPNSEITFTVGDDIEMVFIGDSTCALPVTSPNETSLTVNAVDLSGNSVNGMWTTIHTSDGALLKSGFTPLLFNGTSGTEYKVTVANYDGKVFQRWQDDNSTGKSRIVNLSADTTLTAIYNTGNALRGFTSLTYTGTEEQPDLTVNAITSDGSKALHMWTLIDPQSSDNGTTYRVYATNGYQNLRFDHWEDGSTDRVRTLTISEDTMIAAYYNTSNPADNT